MDVQGFVQLCAIAIAAITTWLALSSENDRDIAFTIGFAAIATVLLALGTGIAITPGQIHGPFSPADIAGYVLESAVNSLDRHFANAQLAVCIAIGVGTGFALHKVKTASDFFDEK